MPDAIGDYEILERIGSGGWGTVYRARDRRIGRYAAIKLLSSGFDDKDVRERFAREARFAARLSHPNIVTIFTVGEHDDMPFVAMEYIQGEALSSFLRRRPHATLTSKLQIIDQLCAGLHHAHLAGMVHGDIRPASIMIDERGVVKILDFGIARLRTSTSTQTGLGLLTPNYMAPEQITGMSGDGRADMFSIGAVFYELLSYRQAFPGDTSFAVMQQIVQGRPEPLGTVCPDLDPGLVAIVSRCLERRPADRHPDLGAVRSALDAERQKLEAEVARLEHERDTARRSFEAEIERLKREAKEAARSSGGFIAASIAVVGQKLRTAGASLRGTLRRTTETLSRGPRAEAERKDGS